MNEGGEQFEWDALVPPLVHPMKVEIIEAMLWVNRPLSAVLLHRLFDKRTHLGLVAYHLRTIVEMGFAEKVGERPARGALETFYVLNDAYLRTPAGGQ